jgi:tricorn protease
MRSHRLASCVVLIGIALASPAPAGPPTGYYRQPAIHKDTIVFVSEGDLWRVSAAGGVAARLTTHAGEEGLPAISPDGKTVAFIATYEGPTAVYTMPLAGGPPRRLTFDGGGVDFVGWAPDGRLLYSTDSYSGLPNSQLVLLDLRAKGGTPAASLVPLAQAAEGCYDDTGKALYFTRLPFQGSHTRRYKGGTAQNLWKFADGAAEAVPLTADYKGTSKAPMWWQGRVYFASDRDGTMNLWSMDPQGRDLKQHTKHDGWDVTSPSLGQGRIVYQLGADLHVYDIAADKDRLVPITLDSDFDQTREHWVKKPMEFLTAAHLSPDGGRVALTARGRVFVTPAKAGRLVEATRQQGVRYRDARFLPDGKSLLALSDESGEVELWKLPADGIGAAEQLTRDATVLRWEAVPSPDGRRIAHHDKEQRLFLYDSKKKTNRLIDSTKVADFLTPRWSPDGRWLAYVVFGDNFFRRVKLYDTAEERGTFVTSERYDSYSPAWSPDGKWLYLLSDRNLVSVVDEPWGPYQPEPFLDRKTKVYHLPLVDGLRSPFAEPDELHPEAADEAKKEPSKPGGKPAPAKVKVALDGIERRLTAVPLPAGNYSELAVSDKALFWLTTPTGEKKKSLSAAAIGNEKVEVKTVAEDVKSFELSQDGKKLLIRKDEQLYVLDAAAEKAELDKKAVDLSGWALSVTPREEWRQMFAEAWRLERDYFYDRKMHGVDWKAVRKKYEPLVDRVASRAELADLTGQMVSELSALHIFVVGGEFRQGEDRVMPASLGARLARDEKKGGCRVEHVYQSDPDEPERAAPLARPEARVKEGEVITMIDGVAALSVPDAGQLLRGKAGKQVRLRVKPAGKGPERDVIVKPIGGKAEADLRYHEWEYTRRLKADELSKGQVGYVHLRAMAGENFTEWAKGFYPAFTRQGLIIDVRHNQGGNIDSWILGRLLRRAWFHWSQRVGASPNWNMQYAFRGHVVVLCDEWTASDGEAFTEGARRLGVGRVIGTRTWGGEIWLSFSNLLVDNGIASSAEYGVYGPEGAWLIEGHGVDPDDVVDNLPHATFKGEDAQLRAAVEYLQKRIKEKPVVVPPVPRYPDKSMPRPGR